jgi:O-antigen/teichoic acid export membrane protein
MSIVTKNIIFNFIAKGWTAVISLVFVPVYINFMGIEAYGLVGIYLSLLALFALLDLGLSTTLNRELARLSVQRDKAQNMRDLLRTLEMVYWIVAILIGVLVILLAPLITHYWVKPNTLKPEAIQQAFVIMGLAIAFYWPFTLYSGGLMGLQLQVLLNGIVVTVATLRAVGAIFILWKISPTVQAFFLWQIFVSVIQTLTTAIFLWIRLPSSQRAARFKKDLLYGVWRFAAGITGISVMAVILTQLDKIILSKILTLEMFGYYSLAWMVASGLYYLVGPIFTAIFPRFSQLVKLNEDEALQQLYHRGCQLLSVVVIPLTVVVALFSTEILLLWTGDASIANNTHLVLSLLIIGTAMNGLMNLPYAMQLAYGWTKLGLYLNLGAVIALVPLVFCMAMLFGATGAAIVWILLNSAYIIIGIQIMHQKLLRDEKWRWYGVDVGLPLTAALVVVVAGRWLIVDLPTQWSMLFGISGIAVVALILSAMSASHLRTWLFQQIMSLKRA